MLTGIVVLSNNIVVGKAVAACAAACRRRAHCLSGVNVRTIARMNSRGLSADTPIGRGRARMTRKTVSEFRARRRRQPPRLHRGRCRRDRAGRLACRAARAGRRAQGRRAAAALRRPGRHRPGLLPRRRARQSDLQGARPARARDHERRHRDQRRGGPRPRREADRRRRAASGRRLRLRPEQRHRPGRRAEGHPVRHQHRRRAADHGAGLQVRVPQLPDRADDSRATRSPTRRKSSRRAARSRSRWCSCTSTTPSAWR